MCTVSAIAENYRDRFPHRWTGVAPWVSPNTAMPPPEISRHDFDDLRREVKELKDLLIQAKKFDEETGQPDCEMEEKVDMIKKLADYVGVDMEDVFPDQNSTSEFYSWTDGDKTNSISKTYTTR